MTKTKLKYCLKCYLHWVLVSLIPVLPLFLCLLITYLYFQKPLDFLPFFPLLFIGFCFFIATLHNFLFLITVRRKEKENGVIFNDDNKKEVIKLLFISNDWLIDATQMTVICKNEIISVEPHNNRCFRVPIFEKIRLKNKTRYSTNEDAYSLLTAKICAKKNEYFIPVIDAENYSIIENWAKNR